MAEAAIGHKLPCIAKVLLPSKLALAFTLFILSLSNDHGSYLLSRPRLRIRRRRSGRWRCKSNAAALDPGIRSGRVSDWTLHPRPNSFAGPPVRGSRRNRRHPADVLNWPGIFIRRTSGSEMGCDFRRAAGYPVIARPGGRDRMVDGLGHSSGSRGGRHCFSRQHHGAFPLADRSWRIALTAWQCHDRHHSGGRPRGRRLDCTASFAE